MADIFFDADSTTGAWWNPFSWWKGKPAKRKGKHIVKRYVPGKPGQGQAKIMSSEQIQLEARIKRSTIPSDFLRTASVARLKKARAGRLGLLHKKPDMAPENRQRMKSEIADLTVAIAARSPAERAAAPVSGWDDLGDEFSGEDREIAKNQI